MAKWLHCTNCRHTFQTASPLMMVRCPKCDTAIEAKAQPTPEPRPYTCRVCKTPMRFDQFFCSASCAGTWKRAKEALQPRPVRDEAKNAQHAREHADSVNRRRLDADTAAFVADLEAIVGKTFVVGYRELREGQA